MSSLGHSVYPNFQNRTTKNCVVKDSLLQMNKKPKLKKHGKRDQSSNVKYVNFAGKNIGTQDQSHQFLPLLPNPSTPKLKNN